MARTLLRGIALVGLASLGSLIAGGAAPADAHPLEQTRGIIQKLGLAPLLCAGTPLAPTVQCAIYNPATETYFNPYTEDGSSPGILGWGSLLGLL